MKLHFKTMSGDKLRVAMFQGGGLDAKANLDMMDKFLGEQSCDVCVFPELFLCGYDNAPFASALEWSELLSAVVKPIIVRHGINVVFGFAEKEGSKLYNTAAFFSGTGKLLMKHRKTHLVRFAFGCFALLPLSWKSGVISRESGSLRATRFLM